MQLLIDRLVDLHAFIYRDDQLVCFILSQLSLGVDDWLHARMDEFLLEVVEILELAHIVDEIVLQSRDRALHVQNAFLLSVQSHGRHGHEVAHDGFSGHHAEFLVPLGASLKYYGHLFSVSLYELVIKLLREFETGNLVVQHADVSEEAFLRIVLDYTGLMAEDYASEELLDRLLLI